MEAVEQQITPAEVERMMKFAGNDCEGASMDDHSGGTASSSHVMRRGTHGAEFLTGRAH